MTKSKKISIEEIEEKALRGEDVNGFFSNGKKMPPLVEQIQRVNVDFGSTTLKSLDDVAEELNVSRQAVIKIFVQRELDHHFLARKARRG